MPTSYTTILKLSLPATGELSGSWGAEINNSITRLLETAVSGASNIVLPDSNYTLTTLNGTADDARAMFLYFTGTLTTTRTITVPAVSKMYVAVNNTAQSLIITNSGGASVTVTAGGSYLLRCSSLGVFAMGKVSAAEVADAVMVVSSAASASVHYPVLSSVTTGTNALEVQSDKLSFIPSTGVLTVTGIAVPGSASGAGLDTYVNTRLASPPAIGSTAAGVGTFTNLSATASATVPTAVVDTNTTAAASTAFVLAQATATAPAMNGTQTVGTSTRFARGDHIHPTDTSRAPIASPTFTGTVTAPTLAVGTAGTAPTMAADNSSTNIATTAFVLGQASTTSPVVDGTATIGTSTRFAKADHVHPTDTSRAPTASPTFTGTVTLPNTGAGANEAATKAYVDAVAVGIDTHTACQRATTAAINLATNGLTAIDGTALTAGNRILVKNQASSIENGIYVAAVGAWARATDADAVGELKQGSYVFVESGTVNQKTGWTQQTAGTITPGSTAIVWAQFSSSSSYTAGTGLSLAGSVFNLATPVAVGNGGTGVSTSTGSGSNVLSTSPTLTTPVLGTPTSGTLTNCTGLPMSTGVTGTLGVGNGGTGGTSAQLGMNALAGAVTSGSYLRGNGTNVVMSTIQAADVPTLNQSTTGNANTATTANHITGGAAGGIAYQTGVGATAINTPGTAGYVLVSGGAGAPSWSATSSLSIGSAAAVAVVDDNASGTTMYPLWSTATSGNVAPKVSSTKISFVPSTGTLTATAFVGNLSGAVSGAVGASTLSASSTVSGAGFSTYLASPPAIGGTTAAAVTGTTITATSSFSGLGTGLSGTASSLTAGAATNATNVYQAADPGAGTYRLLFGNGTNAAAAVYNKSTVYWNDTGSIIQGANISGNAGSASSVAWTNVGSRPTNLSQFTNDLTGYVTTGGALGTPSSGNLANCTFPTLNQSTTGTASNITAYTINQSVGTTNSPSFVDVTITSDESVKTNWRGFGPDLLEKFAKVKRGIYDRLDADVTQAGVSANSFQEVLPVGVTTDANGLRHISQSATLAILAELADLVLMQGQRIAELEARL